MTQNVTPIIHVSNVRQTVEWYQAIDFELLGVNEEDGVMDWAKLAFGDGCIMFSDGGRSSDKHRREVDIYVQTESVDGLFGRLKDQVEIVEEPLDTFYGVREFIIRDINRFWITFGEPIHL